MSRFTVLLAVLALLTCAEPAKTAAPSRQPLRVQVRANNDGFVVANATALTAGVPVDTHRRDDLCTPKAAGAAHLSCAMNMAGDDLRVEWSA